MEPVEELLVLELSLLLLVEVLTVVGLVDLEAADRRQEELYSKDRVAAAVDFIQVTKLLEWEDRLHLEVAVEALLQILLERAAVIMVAAAQERPGHKHLRQVVELDIVE
jgi:hypothetical protein